MTGIADSPWAIEATRNHMRVSQARRARPAFEGKMMRTQPYGLQRSKATQAYGRRRQGLQSQTYEFDTSWAIEAPRDHSRVSQARRARPAFEEHL